MDKNVQLYEDYFLSQSGAGSINVFSGPRYMRGKGFGRILGGLGRAILPLLKRGGRVLLKEGLRTGTQIASDVIGGQKFTSSLKKRGREAGDRMVQTVVKRMRGEGIMAAPPGQPFKLQRKKRSKKKSSNQTRRKTKKTKSRSAIKRRKPKVLKQTKKRRASRKTKRKRSRKSNSSSKQKDIFS